MLITDRKVLSTPSLIDLPRVFIEPSTLAQVEYIVDSVSTTEVAFYLFLKKLKSGDLLIFGNCFIPAQLVSGGAAKTDDIGEAVMTDLIIDLSEEDKTGQTPSDKDLLVHCHSHVLMACTPSQQDGKNLIQRYNEFKNTPNPPEFALQIIFNQKREHYCQVIKMDTPLHEVYTCNIGIYEGIEETVLKRIDQELKENIKEIENKPEFNKITPYDAKPKTNTIYANMNSYVDLQNEVELWCETPLSVLGELDTRQKRIFGIIVKDMLFSKHTTEKQIYERLTTLVNQITKMKDHPEILLYSFNDEIKGYSVFLSYSQKKVNLINTLSGEFLFGSLKNLGEDNESK